MNHNSILFDIGATKTRIAFSENGEYFEEPRVYETPKNFDEALKIFVDTARELAKNRPIEKVAGGMSRSVPELPYDKFVEGSKLSFGTEVIVDNDAAIVGLGEANFGAGRGFNIVAYVTVSTGVGGVRIVEGKIDDRSIGFEPGKQIIDIETKKTLEDLISGKALEKETGKHPKEITDPTVWENRAKILAIGLNNIIVEWSPDVVVLGGSMITGEPAIPLDKTEEHLKEILKIFSQIPPVKKGELGDFGGLYGALTYLKNIN